jgi:iron(III) transport system substrate-binding protein
MMKLQAMLLAAMTASLAMFGPAAAVEPVKACVNPKQMAGFKTCADLAKADAEGELVVYSTDPEHGTVKLLDSFRALFPKIKTNYVRLQAGALYAKVLSERQARSYLVDAMQLSDMGFVLDFQKRNGYRAYVSPEMSAFKPEYKSEPEGYWTWGAIIMAGIAYNPTVVPKSEAPKTWEDVLDPKWTDAVNVKVSNSGLQHEAWYELRRILGPDYFKKFAAVKPRAFDSYVQQYQRVVNGEDKIVHTAQYSGYLEFKAKGAPIEFVYPATGLPAGPLAWGLVSNAPHPNAAELFMDWLLSARGQKVYRDILFFHSPRDDVPPPQGGVAITELKLLFPADWNAFLASRSEFAREWDRITGLRR